MPALENAEIDAAEPVRVGLRPVRPRNVRLETEAGSTDRAQLRSRRIGCHLFLGLRSEVVDRVEELLSPKTTSGSTFS